MAPKPRISDRNTLRLALAKRRAITGPVEFTPCGVLVGVLAMVALSVAFYYASRPHELTPVETHGQAVAPAGDEGPQSELEFSDVQMEAPGNGPLDIFGNVQNRGNHHITGVVVQLTFKDAKGKKLASVEQPIHGKTEGASSTLADDFPIEPEQSRFFHVVINQIPPKWNRELPDLKIVTVSASE
jgi:hypothetical protein